MAKESAIPKNLWSVTYQGMLANRQGALNNPGFVRLWLAHSLSQLGSQVTIVALPLAAAVNLHASATAMGVLSALETVPFILLSLLAGVWVDSRRRRPIMVATDLVRAAVLTLIPLAALSGRLSLELLFAVAFITGCATVLFDIAAQSYLPSLVDTSQIVGGNGKLELSRSVAEIIGPGLGGMLVRGLGAPLAIVMDVVSFALSGLFLRSIRAEEPLPDSPTRHDKLGPAIRAGFAEVLSRPELRAIVLCTATANFFANMGVAIYVLYVVRTLGLGAVWLGAILAVGSSSAVLSAAIVDRLSARWGFGCVLIAGPVIMAMGVVLIPVASPTLPLWLSIGVLIVAKMMGSAGVVLYGVNQRSYRQVVVSPHLMGRVNATVRFLVWGILPLGALAGGALGEALGLRTALLIAGVGGFVAPLWLLRREIWRIKYLGSTT